MHFFFFFFQQAVSHVVIGRLVLHRHLDAEGQETEDGADPEQDGEAAEQLSAELDPLRGGGGWSQGVGTVPGQNLRCSGSGQALGGEQGFFVFCFLRNEYISLPTWNCIIAQRPHFHCGLKKQFYCYSCRTSSIPDWPI